MASSPPASELTRIERLVGEVIGLRLLVTELLEQDEGKRKLVQSGALARLDEWKIGSDTAEGADRIRTYVGQMLAAFPAPVPVKGPVAADGTNSRPA